MKLMVKVTEKHLASGLVGDSENCAVAVALADELLVRGVDPESRIKVNPTHTKLWLGDDEIEEVRHRNGFSLQEFIRRFDSGDYVEPISFEMYVPDGLLPERIPATMPVIKRAREKSLALV